MSRKKVQRRAAVANFKTLYQLQELWETHQTMSRKDMEAKLDELCTTKWLPITIRESETRFSMDGRHWWWRGITEPLHRSITDHPRYRTDLQTSLLVSFSVLVIRKVGCMQSTSGYTVIDHRVCTFQRQPQAVFHLYIVNCMDYERMAPG
jgi:hypothetical protein